MKLCDLIRNYRTQEKISQREFARRCGLSNTYISFLENEMNPKTGRPMIPTLEQYKKIADGIGITLQRLFELLDEDAPVDMRTMAHHYDQPPVFIPDSAGFRILTRYMPYEDYVTICNIYEKAYQKAKEAGENI